MKVKKQEIKLKRPNNKYMRAYIEALEKGYSKLENSSKRAAKKLRAKSSAE